MSDRGVEDVDLLVIGGGKAGKSLAMDRAKAGWKVAMGRAGQDRWDLYQRGRAFP